MVNENKETPPRHYLVRNVRGDVEISFPLTTNFSQNVTELSKGISYPVGDLCRPYAKLSGPCAFTLHRNPIPKTDVTKGLF